MAKKKILVVDDEKSIALTIKAYLVKELFEVYVAYDGEEALNIYNTNELDLIVLDLMIPKISGEEVCKKVRETSNIPIIMLSAKINEENKLKGFALGTDDYITKPFSPKELIARIHSLFKRVNNEFVEFLSFNNNDLCIDMNTYLVKKKGNIVNLTPNEYKILITLAKNPQRTYTRDDLISSLSIDDIYERTIDTHIKNIRNKIEDGNYKYIITIRGFGYKFNDG